MTRWQAVTEIVKSFNSKGRPGYALVALLLMLIVQLAAVLLLSYTGVHIAPGLIQHLGL
jgi:hypothetical protein